MLVREATELLLLDAFVVGWVFVFVGRRFRYGGLIRPAEWLAIFIVVLLIESVIVAYFKIGFWNSEPVHLGHTRGDRTWTEFWLETRFTADEQQPWRAFSQAMTAGLIVAGLAGWLLRRRLGPGPSAILAITMAGLFVLGPIRWFEIFATQCTVVYPDADSNAKTYTIDLGSTGVALYIDAHTWLCYSARAVLLLSVAMIATADLWKRRRDLPLIEIAAFVAICVLGCCWVFDECVTRPVLNRIEHVAALTAWLFILAGIAASLVRAWASVKRAGECLRRSSSTVVGDYHQMIDPSHQTDSSSHFSCAIGVPMPQGRSRVTAACLLAWLVGNFVWIVGGLVDSQFNPVHTPPPGWVYWCVWCSGGTAMAALLVACVRYLRFTGWLWFFGLALAMCVLEEALCYAAGTGMWEGRTRFWPEFGVGIGVLMSWSIGTALVVRQSGLAVWPALLLCGFSGWIAEAFMVPRFFANPLLMLWIIPLSIVSYLLLVLPGIAAVGPILPPLREDRSPRTRGYLAALFVPVACWILAAVLISRYVKI